MKAPKKTLLASLLGVSVLMSGAGVYAAQSKTGQENDATAAASASVDLTQAVKIALQQTSGTATQAQFSNDEGKALWEVEVFDGKVAFDIEIDANTGKLLKKSADTIDTEDREDEGEDNDDDE